MRKLSLDEEIKRAKKVRDEGNLLSAASMLLRLIKNNNTPIDRMEEIMDIYIPVYEKYLKKRGIIKCLECRGWARKDNSIAKCPMCGAIFPIPE